MKTIQLQTIQLQTIQLQTIQLQTLFSLNEGMDASLIFLSSLIVNDSKTVILTHYMPMF